MKNRWFQTIQRAVLLIAALTAGAHAEATKEIYGDGGLYGVPPSNFTNLQIFGGSAGTTNLNRTDIAGTPEGKTVIEQTVPAASASFWGIINTNSPGSQTIASKNYTEYLGGSLRFWLKSVAPVKIAIQYSGVVPDPSITIPSTGDVWQEQVILLSSLGATPARLATVRIPFIFIDENAGGAHSVYLDHIRWTKPVNSLVITPTTVQANPNTSREFTVEGRDFNNELVMVYPTFTSTVGTMSPAKGQASILTLGAGTTDGTVTATTDGKSAVANVDVITTPIANKFGILSETHTGAQLGEDNPLRNSDLLLFSETPGNPATFPVISDISGVSPEGGKHNKMVFQRKTASTQFQGMAIQWGVGASPDTHVLDMSTYYSGSIRFWIKGDATATELRNKLTLGIRSGNIPAGKETSSVKLSDYVTFNGQWQPVVIPLSALAKGRPFADLSRTKVFFVLSVAGTLLPTAELQRTVYIDNVRWDTQTPGSLASITISGAAPATNMPVGLINQFTASGFDAAGVPVDIFPTWSFASTSLGTFTQTSGPITFLRTVGSPATGIIRAQSGAVVGTLNGSVVNQAFPGVWNIFTDAGAGGELQVFTGLEGSETGALVESIPDTGVAGDPAEYIQTTFALDNLNPPANDSFAAWGIVTGGLPLQHFNTGYLRFFVRSPRNLEIALRSTDIDPNFNKAKVTLSELGVPLTPIGGGAWQQVLLPLSLFSQRDSLLDLSEIVDLFVVGTNSGLVGEITDQFDIDRVEYLSPNVLPNLPPTVNVGPDQLITIGTQHGNGQVDGHDFLVWQRNFGNTPASPTWYAPADISGNGSVDAADYTVWRDHYGIQCGTPGCDVADIDPPTANTQFNSAVSDDGKPTPPATLTLTWSVIDGDANQVVFSDVSDPFATVYFKAPGIYGLRLAAFDGQFTSADTVSVTVEAAGAAAAAVMASEADQNFTITTPQDSEVRVITTQNGAKQVETVGIDVSNDFARLKVNIFGDTLDYLHAVTPIAAQRGGSNQTGTYVRSADATSFMNEIQLLAKAFEIVLPYATAAQENVLRGIMNEYGITLSARRTGAEGSLTPKAQSRGTFFRPSRGEQGEITFAVTADSPVRIVIYDRLGQQVRALVNTSVSATPSYTATWDGRDDNGSVVSPGTYLVDCQIGGERVKVKAVVSQ